MGVLFIAGSAQGIADDTISIICSTTTLGALAEEVGGDRVTVISLVQPGVCPSHFDIRPSHVADVEQAQLILFHGIEPWLEDLITASGNDTITRLHLTGPWNTPALAQVKIEAIRDALVSIDPGNASYYQNNAEKAIENLIKIGESIQADIDQYTSSEIPVLCMDWQTSFVEWMGFTIVGSYGPPETLSMKDIDLLITTGKTEKAQIVIDNLQSGTDVGSEVAAAIGAEHVALSNYPFAVPGTDTVAQMIEYNARQLTDTIRKIRAETEEINELEARLKESRESNQIFKVLALVFFIVSVVEALLLHVRRK